MGFKIPDGYPLPSNKPIIVNAEDNIRLNADGTVSPIDPTKPSKYNT